MSPSARRALLLALVAADLLVFGGWLGVEQFARKGAQLRLPVEGYDPRDLLSGHYVRFRLVAVREAEAMLPAGAPRTGRFCLEDRQGLLHVSRPLGHGQDCKLFLTSTAPAAARGVDFGVDRFYVDERKAASVASVVAGPQTYVVATIDGGGRVAIVDLVVNGRSLGSGP